MSTIQSLHARQILDSRGNPTIEVDCILGDGSIGRAAVPSGASTGSHEALELRDGGKGSYGGKSVLKAIANVHGPILSALRGKDAADQRALDRMMIELDDTPNKAKLGANAILGVSMAVAKARAVSEKHSLWQSLADQFGIKNPNLLPVPLMNVVNGGKHADSGLSFQECMIIPVDFPTFAEALRAGAEIFHALKKLLQEAGHITAVGDEGGFAPHVKNSGEAFDFLHAAIEKTGYKGRVHLGIDAAASEFCEGKKYMVDGQVFSSLELTQYYAELSKEYGIISIEDSHAEDDWEGFSGIVKAIGDHVQIVGDDLLVTNVERIKKAIEGNAANAVLIKLNQIGTVSETVDAVLLAQKNGWNAVISHRSGETEDTFIAHLAVALRAGQIKTGSLSRSDRTAKYNELLRIEEELGEAGEYRDPFGG
ncbi:MAG TPA: phosphopyruvate hydratase [Candidatus Peribacterales bacterium]|nr:phosphopyruvate hydratase [Candidatus Peribacterales bacterium]